MDTIIQLSSTTDLVIDAEFKALVPPLTPDELAGLEASIIQERRALDPLKVWNGTLIDGHNRYEICTRHGLPFETQDVGGPAWTRSTAIIWIIKNQFARRNLTSLDRISLALRLEQEFEALAKANLQAGGGDQKSVSRSGLTISSKAIPQQKEPEADDIDEIDDEPYVAGDTNEPEPVKWWDKPTIAPVNTRKEVATAAHVSEDTYRKGKVVLAQASEKAKAAIQAGKSTINREYKEIVKEQKRDDRDKRHEAIIAELPARTERFQVIHCSVADLAVPSNSVDCIITDPPYPAKFLPVYADLAVTAARILRPGGSCFVMIGQSYLPEIIASLAEYLTYQWTLAYMTPGGQATQLWERKVNTFWKPVLWFVKGTYSGDWLGDVAQSRPNDNDKRFHHWGQSESGMADLVARCSVPGQVVCDPFCGAGTTGVVAIDLGRKFIGCDIDLDCVTRTIGRLNEGVNDAGVDG